MKLKKIMVYSGLFLLLSVFTINLVTYSLTGKHITTVFLFDLPKEKEISIESISQCSSRPKIENAEMAQDPHIRKLSQYQDVCNSFVTNRMMIFTDMPKDTNVAKEAANNMSVKLKEFSQLQITPIVIIEPVTEWGLIDFREFRTGFYDDWIDVYFATLKEQGVTNDMMGIWVPFPEANLPNWNHSNATPEDFSAIVNKYLTTLRKHFPAAKTSILLNSATYENDDFNWASGEYVSLVQYVEEIDKGLVDSFGIQGFPWTPPATQGGSGISDAREFLNSRLAIEAANVLDTKEIWFNTGSFSSKYNLDSEQVVYITAEKRKAILNSIFEEVLNAKKKGYDVSVNLFAEDKSVATEATNWSYWDGDAAESEGKAIFKSFFVQLENNEIPMSLFDVQK